MSQENVDRFVQAIEAFNHSDIPGVLRIMDSEIQFEHRVAALQGEYSGLDGVRDFFADFGESFDAWHIDSPDVRDLGDRVLALGTLHATGKGSGAETEQTFAVVARFRDGRVTQYIDFGDRNQALEAAGLSE